MYSMALFNLIMFNNLAVGSTNKLFKGQTT